MNIRLFNITMSCNNFNFVFIFFSMAHNDSIERKKKFMCVKCHVYIQQNDAFFNVKCVFATIKTVYSILIYIYIQHSVRALFEHSFCKAAAAITTKVILLCIMLGLL